MCKLICNKNGNLGWTSMDILVRSWQDLGTILAKILARSWNSLGYDLGKVLEHSWLRSCRDLAMVRSYQKSHVPKKKFYCKILSHFSLISGARIRYLSF